LIPKEIEEFVDKNIAIIEHIFQLWRKWLSVYDLVI